LPRLDWIPNKLKAPRYLRDFQRAWWRDIVDAMFDNADKQGYLPATENFWRIAGAHSRPMWEAHSGAVMACFESAEVTGRGKMIFYPPLLDLIDTQRGKLRGTKRARESPSNSLSQSVFDFEVQNQNRITRAEKRPAKSAKLLEREELERRDQLTATTRKGLRDYKKHPLENWEKVKKQA
jgi:hypothetical protein